MFGIDFSELLIIGVVALVVLGPERLPKVARTAGHLLGRLQRYVSQVKSDLNRELELDELRKFQSQVMNSARELESSVQREIDSARSAFDVPGALSAPAADAADPTDAAPPHVLPAALPFDTDVSYPVDQTRPVA
ncbi:MAG: Sec-independent protein translocase protein TatB [Zoogloeaceae bacterium]|jgi:sec-independent protein translocase protein TatB|nr:Sec-independent protein translocase protein TatB [Zoogloeaceae bacterium]